MTYTEAHHQGVMIRFHFESQSAVSVLNIILFFTHPTIYYINKRRQPFCIVFKICLCCVVCFSSLHHYNTTRDASSKDCVILISYFRKRWCKVFTCEAVNVQRWLSMCQQALLVVSITAVPRSPLCRQMLHGVRECRSAMSLMCFEVLKHTFVRMC